MSQRVFRQRLKNQIRHQRPLCRRIDVELDPETIGKPHLLNSEIQLNEVQLLPQFNFLPRRMLERVTQQIAESDEHIDCCLVLVVTNETGDAVQGVEEKVRMQLHAQRIELRLRELCFKTRRQNLAFAVLAIVVERITDADHTAVDQQVRTERTQYASEKARPERFRTVVEALERIDAQEDYSGSGAVQDGRRQERRQVDQQVSLPRTVDE